MLSFLLILHSLSLSNRLDSNSCKSSVYSFPISGITITSASRRPLWAVAQPGVLKWFQPPLAKSLRKLNLKCKLLKVFWTWSVIKGRELKLGNLIFAFLILAIYCSSFKRLRKYTEPDPSSIEMSNFSKTHKNCSGLGFLSLDPLVSGSWC